MTSNPSTGDGGGELSAAGTMTGVNSTALIPSVESGGEGSAASVGKSADETLAGDRSEGDKRPFLEVSVMEKMESEDLADSTLEEFEDAPETLVPCDGGDENIDGGDKIPPRNLESTGSDVSSSLNDDAETLVPAMVVKTDLGVVRLREEEVAIPQETENTDFKADSSIVGEKVDNSMVLDRGSLNLNVEGEDLPNPVTYMDAKPSPLVVDDEKEALVVDQDKKPKNDQQARCHSTAEEENRGFSATDMVWGKIKSHPWWPGQIFDQKYASDLALKHRKKDRGFLVAYFGDKSFAWCEESQLKPFRPCFAQMEGQSNIGAFAYAVEEALEEVSRRVELGMLCHCMAEETYSHLKNNEVENAGIQEGTCGAIIDTGPMVDSFVLERLLEYVRSLACCPLGKVDRLELVTATAQIKAFYRSKGVTELSIFADGGTLVEHDVEVTPPPKSKKSGKGKADKSAQDASDVLSGKKKSRGRPRKYQDLLQDGVAVAVETTVSSGKKSRCRPQKIQDAMEDGKAIGDGSGIIYGEKRPIVKPRKPHDAAEDKDDEEYVSNDSTLLSGKKRGRGRPHKVQNVSQDGDIWNASNGKGGASGAKSTPHASGKRQRDDDLDYEEERGGSRKRLDYSDKASPSSYRRAVKIGERIRRVASQVQEGSLSIFKSSFEESQGSVAKGISGTEYHSPEEMLSQLCLAARDPTRGYSFVPTIVSFFASFKSLNSSKEEKPLKAAEGKRGRKKKVDSEAASLDLPVVDPYWSDRQLLVDSSPETVSVSRGRKRKKASKVKKQNKKAKSAGEPLIDPSVKQELAEGGRSDYVAAGKGPRNDSLEKVDDYSPTALILSFTEADSLPCAADLIKIFSPYGPLKEDETEVMMKSNRAKVVFKRRNDAETAFSSAGKYSVFGPALVSYRLRYSQLPSKVARGTSPEDKKDATLQSLPTDSQATSPEDKKDAIMLSLPTASQATSEDKKDAMLSEVGNMELQTQEEATVVANDNT